MPSPFKFSFKISFHVKATIGDKNGLINLGSDFVHLNTNSK